MGAGNLGSALLGYTDFEKAGIRIVAAFDSPTRPRRAGRSTGSRCSPRDQFEHLARERRIAIGIITVPADRAQRIAEIMVRSGLQAIWNFAPITLDVPEEIIVENVELLPPAWRSSRASWRSAGRPRPRRRSSRFPNPPWGAGDPLPSSAGPRAWRHAGSDLTYLVDMRYLAFRYFQNLLAKGINKGFLSLKRRSITGVESVVILQTSFVKREDANAYS